jgi:hypothetical protein
MADYTITKPAVGTPIPVNGVVTTWQRHEPLLEVQDLKDLYLFGIPLFSPITRQQMTDAMLQKHILKSIPELELETGLTFAPVQHEERQAFDQNEYLSMGYMRLRNRPVSSIEAMEVLTSNNQVLWTVSTDWIDAGRLHEGLIYIVPINVAVASSTGSGGAAGGAAFLAILGQQSWVPAYWRVRYTTGWPDTALPKVVNSLIGYHAAIKVLTLLAQANAKSGSKSLGIGGLSQSSSNPGPDVYTVAITHAQEQKDLIIKKLKSIFGVKLFSGNI